MLLSVKVGRTLKKYCNISGYDLNPKQPWVMTFDPFAYLFVLLFLIIIYDVRTSLSWAIFWNS